MTSPRMRWLALAAFLAAGCGGAGAKRPPTGNPVAANGGAPAADRVRFTDITREAGLDFRQSHGGCGKAYFVEQTGAGTALFDMDADGDLDLYFPQATWLPGCNGEAPLQAHLYRNDGTGHFTAVSNAGGATCSDYGIGAAVGDYNRDGRPDLFVSCYGRSHLFRNEGGGRFKDVTASARIDRRGYSTSATWLDYDRDGHLDLYVCGYVEWTHDTPVRCPAPDGKPDYCTPEAFPPGRNSLFRNRGDGTFEDATAKAGLGDFRDRALGVLAADLDSDGWLDLFVSNDNGANMLLRNLGNGRFTNEAMIRAVAFGAAGNPQANMGIAAGDYDRDADLDVLVTTFANEPYTLYRNDGDFFKDVSASCGLAEATYLPLGFGTHFFDADQDGWLDLFFANGHVEQYIAQRSNSQTFRQSNQIFLGSKEGKFIPAPPGALPSDGVRVHRGLARGDVDGDGDLDLVVTALDDRPTLLRNDSPGGHWLTVDVRDAAGSPSAVGARVRIRSGGETRTGWVTGGGSYLSHSDDAVHFGLGAETRVDSVEVTWLDGARKELKDVAADHRLRVDPPGRRSASAPPGSPPAGPKR